MTYLLFFLFFYHANHVGAMISPVWKSTGILAHRAQVNASLLLEGLSNAFVLKKQLSNFGNAKALIK